MFSMLASRYALRAQRASSVKTRLRPSEINTGDGDGDGERSKVAVFLF